MDDFALYKTLLTQNVDGISNINAEQANQIVELLKLAQNRGILEQNEVLQVVQAIKTLSITRSIGEVYELLFTITNERVSTNLIKKKIRWWRKFVKYLIVSGFTIIAIDKLVPIQFKLIGQMVFTFIKSLGTNSLSTMKSVSGIGAFGASTAPTIPMQLMSQTIRTFAEYAYSTCGIAVGAIMSVCSVSNTNILAEIIADSAAVKLVSGGIGFFTKFNNGMYDDALAIIIENRGNYYNDALAQIVENVLVIDENRVHVVLDDKEHVMDRSLIPSTKSVIEESFKTAIEQSQFTLSQVKSDFSQLSKSELIIKYGIAIVVLYDLQHPIEKVDYRDRQPRRISRSMPRSHKVTRFSQKNKLKKTKRTWHGVGRVSYEDETDRPNFVELPISLQITKFKYIDEFTSDDECIKQVLQQPLDITTSGNLYTAIRTNNLTDKEQHQILNDIMDGCKQIRGDVLDASYDAELIVQIANRVRERIQEIRPACSGSHCLEENRLEQWEQERRRQYREQWGQERGRLVSSLVCFLFLALSFSCF